MDTDIRDDIDTGMDTDIETNTLFCVYAFYEKQYTTNRVMMILT